MRRITILLWIAFCSLTAQAQHNLSGSRQSSVHTYIYRVSAKETQLLYSSQMDELTDKFLHTQVDSFVTDGGVVPSLKAGNYLFIQVNGNRLEGELKTIDDLQIKLINNNRDLLIVVHDKKGQLIKEVQVLAGKKKVPYDAVFQAFRLPKKRKAGLIKVTHQGILHCFPLEKQRNNSLWRTLAYSFPLKYIVVPVRRLLNGSGRYRRYRSFQGGATAYEKKFKGFMVFSKPIYKPGDTLKLKAWITSQSGKPINRPLLLRLTDRRFEVDSIIATIQPYRPGGYEYSFVLNDSLDLTLDQQHQLTLEELSSRKYNLDEYEGDLSEDEYAANREVLMRGKFFYEEDELASVTFNARTDKKTHTRGNTVALYCKATDENDMAIMDGRVELLVRPLSNGAITFSRPETFLPDTLWRYAQAMESIGETKIAIPDSIFPAASFGYEITCTFLNSNNEQKVVTLQQRFDNVSRQIIFDQQNDSLHISMSEAGKDITAKARLYTFTAKDDTINSQLIQLPMSLRMDPFAAQYEVAADSVTETFKPEKSNSIIACRSLRTRDSVMIQVVNPHRLPFWYAIFAGNKLIHRGYGDSLLYIERSRTAKHYFVSLQYIYADEPRLENYTIPFRDKTLTIQVNQPAQVYPGQQVKVDIAVTDAAGMPVEDADVTAYAFTRKFSNVPAPKIPYLGKTYPQRKWYNQFYHRQQNLEKGSVHLNWKLWSRELGLDSIEYYRFLHPGTIYTNTEAARHDTTQIAPFVVLDGELQPVHLLYIDEEPRFFSQSQQLPQYSFEVRPGKHALRIRTHDRLIYLDSIWAAPGRKTFFAINADTSNKAIRQLKMPDTLTNDEKALWSKYMILMENNFDGKPVILEQNNRLMALNLPSLEQQSRPYVQGKLQEPSRRITLSEALAGRTAYNGNYILTGPLSPIMTYLYSKERYTQSFVSEGNYLFNISQGLIKQKQLPYGSYAFRPFLSHERQRPYFRDYVLTARDIDSLWQDYLDHRNASEDLFRKHPLNKNGNGLLRIGSPVDEKGQPHFTTAVILFRYDDPDFARIYRGNARELGYVQPGMYRLMFLLRDDQYFIKDSIRIRQAGINYYDVGSIVPRTKDSTSKRISTIINNRKSDWRSVYQTEDVDLIKHTFNDTYLDLSVYSRLIVGKVTDHKTGEPLAGATIMVKGTRVGTSTRPDGYFELRVPERATIEIAYIGYNAVSRKITDGSSYDIKMVAAKYSLSEVVVVGYGTQRRMSLTASVSSVTIGQSLQGKVAGIFIRGASSVEGTNAPLVIVDGLPYTGSDWNTIDKKLITDIRVLKSAEAVAIYGSQAANGVILVTTNKQVAANAVATGETEGPVPGNTLRRNFRDDAYWQPTLRTDQQGKTSFIATYPDDITNWRSFVIAMGSKKRTGFVEQSVRAFKALSGAIALPQFAVEGDSVQVIGKTMNYGVDSITIRRTFSLNGALVQDAAIGLRNAYIDSFKVVIAPGDSSRFKYTIQKGDGYFDGEERSIPVFKQGVQETKGFFATLEADTSFVIQPEAGLGNMTLYAETSVLPVLLDEIESLRQYEYLCNEQVASKLKALLLKKKVYGYLKKEFKEEKNIRDLITRLNQSKSQGVLWGWWSNNEPVLWISRHVTEALLMAEQQGYMVNLNKQAIIDFLVYRFDQYSLSDQIVSVRLLQNLASKVDYKKYLDTLDKKVVGASLYEKLQVLQLKQQAGFPVLLDTFITKQHHTMFGNIYWGDEKYQYHFFNNTIQNTLAMYRLLLKAGNQEQLLKKIRYYFLEKRKDGRWRNTYESALILETIMPDLLNTEQTLQPASFTIAGSQSRVVNTFPYTATFPANEKLTITKQKGMPVYFTAYQQSWNPAPKKVAGDFEVQSGFERNGQSLSILKGGEAVTLKVHVTVKADADYVMVEIPIPAGCSYKDKNQSWANNEVHREYFKNKVSIFCSSLRKGEYTFNVSLLPRFTGRYHLNPAKAEMMYFPVFYGREEMKQVSIR